MTTGASPCKVRGVNFAPQQDPNGGDGEAEGGGQDVGGVE